jgi:hypothetical protein
VKLCEDLPVGRIWIIRIPFLGDVDTPRVPSLRTCERPSEGAFLSTFLEGWVYAFWVSLDLCAVRLEEATTLYTYIYTYIYILI